MNAKNTMTTELLSNGYTTVDPIVKTTACYWVAANGRTMALVPPNPAQSCIANVEDDIAQLFGCRGPAWNDIYVIWQPVNCSQSVWNRWQKKWSARTSATPHL